MFSCELLDKASKKLADHDYDQRAFYAKNLIASTRLKTIKRLIFASG